MTLFFIIAITCNSALSDIHYVKEEGTGDGSSFADANGVLHDMIDAPGSGDEVWVAAGIYHPTKEAGGTGDIYKTFQMKNGVAIYGGFAGNETATFDVNDRDLAANETILSGDLLGNDTPGLDPCDFPDDPNRADNCYHVFFHPDGTDLEPNAILDGFTITAGNGGGMYNRSSSPTVTNCTFSRNSAGHFGGGMSNSYGPSAVTNCTFSGNSAGYAGGGMFNYSGTIVTNCTFSGNSAYDGGGMCNYYVGYPTVTGCTFSGNSANTGGGMSNIYYSDPAVSNCVLWGNSASVASQIYNDFTGLTTVSYSDIEGCGGSISWDPNIGSDGGGNIDADPCFVDFNGPDETVGTDDDNLRIRMNSACIDAGDNDVLPADILDLDNDGNTVEPLPYDLDGRERIVDGDCNDTIIVDMGAYEFGWLYLGDFAGGCDVDFVDFAVLGLTWLKVDGQAGYDPNCDISLPADDFVDEKDLKIFTDNWLAGL
ncbi:MAG: right-handed parallel beta-helix repeat-containing protein [Sedimentisphaerales bacterium]|nr:right-handed parallel beta-helix repeat-containing protein [Sedimentisphaerales bacterium]